MQKTCMQRMPANVLMALLSILAPWAASCKKQLMSDNTCIAHKTLHVTNDRPHKGGY